jgi:hypothetical protein
LPAGTEFGFYVKVKTQLDTEELVGTYYSDPALNTPARSFSSFAYLELDGKTYTIGALVMSNFGSAGNLRVDGAKEGERIQALLQAAENKDKGSIIMLIATDIPLSERQLKRVCKRAGVGLARTGSYYGNGSGEYWLRVSKSTTGVYYVSIAGDRSSERGRTVKGIRPAMWVDLNA